MTNTFIEMLRERHSLRRFSPEPLDAEQVEALIAAAESAPSSKNIKPWRFAVVTGREDLEKLAVAKDRNGSFIRHAPLAMVVMADETLTDCWIEDASIAATFIQLTAESLGLGSCWVQIRGRRRSDGSDSEQIVREIVGVENLRVLCMLAIGHPEQSVKP